MKAYITIQQENRQLGTLHMILYNETVPRTCKNFVGLFPRYKNGCLFHRIIPNFMAQSGDYENGNGTGGQSSLTNTATTFDDENFIHAHTKRGILSMANSGKNTNASQFFITFTKTSHLDKKHVVFGHVDLVRSGHVLDMLEKVPTDTSKDNRPLQPVMIVDCGLEEEATTKQQKAATTETEQQVAGDDDNEIDLDEEENNDDDNDHEEVGPVEDEEEKEQPKTKAEAMKLRLRKLKQKMNQARQLNKQAVREEGEQVAQGGGGNHRYKSKKKEKAQQKMEWEKKHAKAVQLAASHTTEVDAQALAEPAKYSNRKTRIREEQQNKQQYNVSRDYHNPESQYLNYERSLKSLPTTRQRDSNNDHPSSAASTTTTAAIYNPVDATMIASTSTQIDDDREGARRVAAEAHRRIDKQQERNRKRKEKEMMRDGDGGGEEGSYINPRNKEFNKKINRDYNDPHTAEIRQNLERGTAGAGK